MAKLEIELSEYDAMREARKAAEARVEELKQENKDLRSSSKVIIRREIQHLIPRVEEGELTDRILYQIKKTIQVKGMSGGVRKGYPYINVSYPALDLSPVELAQICVRCWNEGNKHYAVATSMDTEMPSRTDTLVGFEDIRLKVEEMLKEQIQQEHKTAVDSLNSERDSYKKRRTQLSEELIKEYEAKYRANIEALKKRNEELEKQLEETEKQLKEASKSNEEKLAELQAAADKAEEELRKFLGKKKCWWRK
jgi:hypothetical protein